MTNYSEQLRTVKRFKVKEGHTRRFNCPFCNGYNTLGVSVINGVLEWNCFKASCIAHGVFDDGHSLEGIKSKLETNINTLDARVQGKPIPEFLATVDRNEEVLSYLESVNSLLAYKLKFIDIRYAPAEDRVMFPILDSGSSPVGFTGRRLGHYGPKWVKYGDLSSLFACGRGQTGVLVEDAPSACAVGVLPDYTGVSLLGTSLTVSNKHQLISQFKKLIICLDPDAAGKSLQLSARLSGLIPTQVKLIPDDLKYFNPQKILEILTNE